MPSLRCELSGPVAIVTLDHPPANALGQATLAELHALCRRLVEPDVGAVVLTGTGRFFSAGLDLFALLAQDDAAADLFAGTFDDAMTAWFGLERPVVAAVNGHAIAGGAVLAATADFRLVADAKLQMGLSEIRVGVQFPTSALEIVRTSCAGPALAELLYRGATYGAAESVQRRLADELVPAAELLERSIALATELSAYRLEAFLRSKRALRAEAQARMAAVRVGGLDPVWRTWRTPETRAAIERFREQSVGNKKKV